MTAAELHKHLNDTGRLEALRATALLDTPAEEAFDRLARLAARLTGAPMALVTLIDAERQFFKSCFGLPEPWQNVRQTPLAHSFCRHNRIPGVPMIIPDARQDERFRDNPAITDLNVIAYLGVPLVVEDTFVLGSFCVIDSVPRTWSKEEIDAVRDLAAAAMSEINLRTALTRKRIAEQDRDDQAALSAALQQEIAARRQAEASLSESEARFRKIFEGAATGIAVTDWQGRFEQCNPAYCKMLGYDMTEMRNLVFWALVHPDDREANLAEIRRLQAGRSAFFEVENRYVRKDGSTLWVRKFVSVLPDQTGRPAHLVALITDMTARRQADAELRHLRRYLAEIIDAMPSVLIGVDSQKRVTLWNRQAVQATGLAPSQAEGRQLAEVFGPLADRTGLVDEAMTTRQVYAEARKPRREGAETRYENVTIYPVAAEDIEGAVIRVDDVTERVRLEEMMVQSEKMLSVGGLAAGMAHEINNPLAGMIQTADVLRDRLTNLDLAANQQAAEQAGTTMAVIAAFMEVRGIIRMLARIREAGGRAAEIVTNMLSFAKKSSAAFSTHDPAELLDSTVTLAGSDYDLKKKYDFRQVAIIREYEPGVPAVLCEASKIRQVLFNLLRNGAEAMHERWGADIGRKGRFTLRLTQEVDQDMVRIDIQDNGPGMEESVRRRVFEPFFTTKTADRGTGLGLSVSYFIVVENHGGQMSVESTPGVGTTFTIWLPVERKRRITPQNENRPDSR